MTWILTIDPGIDGTGWALWNADARAWNRIEPPLKFGCINYRKPTKDGWLNAEDNEPEWFNRASIIAYELSIYATPMLKRAFIEEPIFMDSGKGRMVARRQDLVKLSVLVGLIGNAISPQPVSLVPIQQWKGQLPKDVVQRRIIKRIGTDFTKGRKLTSHEWDAIGIGLHLKETVKAEKETAKQEAAAHRERAPKVRRGKVVLRKKTARKVRIAPQEPATEAAPKKRLKKLRRKKE